MNSSQQNIPAIQLAIVADICALLTDKIQVKSSPQATTRSDICNETRNTHIEAHTNITQMGKKSKRPQKKVDPEKGLQELQSHINSLSLSEARMAVRVTNLLAILWL